MDKVASSVGLWVMRSSSQHVTFLAQQVAANCKVFNVIKGDLGLRCKRMQKIAVNKYTTWSSSCWLYNTAFQKEIAFG